MKVNDSIECGISMRRRREKQALYEKHLDSIVVPDSDSASPIKRVANYADYVDAHDGLYGSVMPRDEDERFLAADPYRCGYDMTTVDRSTSGSFLESNVELLQEQPKLNIRSLGERLGSSLDQYISGLYAACDTVWDQYYGRIDYAIWNVVLKKDGPGLRVPYSMSWHYDLHYPKRYFKILVGLNDVAEHGGGTELLDSQASAEFTDATGYIGMGMNRRASEIAFRNELRSRQRRFSPSFADALIFWPKRVLHRGRYPERAHRRMLFVSACPVPRSLRAHRQAITHLAFRKAMRSNGPYDTPIWWGFARDVGGPGAGHKVDHARGGTETATETRATRPQGQPDT